MEKCPYLKIAKEDEVPPFVCLQGYSLLIDRTGKPHPAANCREFIERYTDRDCNRLKEAPQREGIIAG